MYIDLVNMDIYTSNRSQQKKSRTVKVGGKTWPVASSKGKQEASKGKVEIADGEYVEWVFGSYSVVRQGISLLQDKCALKLQVERNLDTAISHAGM